MKGTSPSRGCGEVAANGIKRAMMEFPDFISTTRRRKSCPLSPSESISPRTFFAVHGVNENGQPALVKPTISRDQLLSLIANLPPCLIGWRACFGNTATPSNSWPQVCHSRGRGYSRLTMEAPVRVFHQGPGKMPNMTVCSFAVHLLTQRAQRGRKRLRKGL